MKYSTQQQPSESAGNFWTPVRSALTLLALALITTLGLNACGGPGAKTDNAGAPKATVTVNGAGPRVNASKGTEAPPARPTTMPESALNTELKTMDGKAFKLADLNGKVLVIDLWATWCGPCRASTPELVNIQKEFGPRGLEVIGLDIDPDSDTPEDVKAFADQYKINYKVAFAERELAMSLMSGGNIPQSLVVGRDGKIVDHFVGYHPVRTPEKLRAAIEKALQ
jgi:cytochrome c biogenesis protein CcmG/thiol:disulfide interchange protein DsbE